jgi:hypothetical protein
MTFLTMLLPGFEDSRSGFCHCLGARCVRGLCYTYSLYPVNDRRYDFHCRAYFGCHLMPQIQVFHAALGMEGVQLAVCFHMQLRITTTRRIQFSMPQFSVCKLRLDLYFFSLFGRCLIKSRCRPWLRFTLTCTS